MLEIRSMAWYGSQKVEIKKKLTLPLIAHDDNGDMTTEADRIPLCDEVIARQHILETLERITGINGGIPSYLLLFIFFLTAPFDFVKR